MFVCGFCVSGITQNGSLFNETESKLLNQRDSIIKDKGKGNVEYLRIMISLYDCYKSFINTENAIVVFNEIKDLLSETTIKGSSLEYVKTLRNLATKYRSNISELALAELLFQKAVFITKMNVKTNYKDYVKSIWDLSTVYMDMGYDEKAEVLLLEISEITEKNAGKNNNDYIKTLFNLVNFYKTRKIDYQLTERYYLEILDISKDFEGKEKAIYMNALVTTGRFCLERKKYEQSLKHLSLAKDYYHSNENDVKFTDYTRALLNLSALYQLMSDNQKAEECFLESLSATKEVTGQENEYLKCLQATVNFYLITIMDSVKAEKHLKDMIMVCEKNITNTNFNYYCTASTKLGNLLDLKGELSEAENYFLKPVNISTIDNTKYANYIKSLENLTKFYRKTGNISKAEYFFLKWKEYYAHNGTLKDGYVDLLFDLASFYLSIEKYKEVLETEIEACQILRMQVQRAFTFYSNNRRSEYWEKISPKLEIPYSLLLHIPQETTSLAYDNTLFSKGLLLRTENRVKDAIMASGDSILINNYNQLLEMRLEIIELQKNSDTNEDDEIKSLEKSVSNLERLLTIATNTYNELSSDLQMTWQDVQRHLNREEAAIEFVHFRLFDKHWTDSTMYAALILRPGMKTPEWIVVCEQQKLQDILQSTNQNTQLKTENLYIDRGKELYQLIWKALEKELSGIKTVYYSPSGLLHKISFNALPTEEEGVLLPDKYNLNLVSSSREIARLKTEIAQTFVQDSTVVYGGLTYDMQQSAMLAAASRYKSYDQPSSTDNQLFMDKRRQRDAELPDAELRSGLSKWNYLSGTKAETEQIVSSLESKEIPHQYYTENNGNEESFKQLDGTKTEVIHLATHGFFLPDIENPFVEDLVQRLGAAKEKPFENPLLRSGLIMSGANNQWVAKDYIMENDIEDGILTADEISRLNLTKTKLVVLSACETGLGDVKNSEGVFGLQRAFKLAGVESLIMSLWKVPDDATAELMTTFYEQWLSGQTKQNAFKAAQLKVREKYESPYYWAAFVMMD